MGAGRPSKYHSHVEPRLAEIEQWARDGLFEYQIAKNLGVGHDAWISYKAQFAELQDALKNGFMADTIVENAAFQMAKSGKFPIMTMWWLQNRRSNKWRNKQPEAPDESGTDVLKQFAESVETKATKSEKVEL